jgi:hypothetical protein
MAIAKIAQPMREIGRVPCAQQVCATPVCRSLLRDGYSVADAGTRWIGPSWPACPRDLSTLSPVQARVRSEVLRSVTPRHSQCSSTAAQIWLRAWQIDRACTQVRTLAVNGLLYTVSHQRGSRSARSDGKPSHELQRTAWSRRRALDR